MTRKQVGISLLVTDEIAGDPTLRNYAKTMQEFETFCLARDMELDFQVPAKLDPALLEYLDHLYLEEEKSVVGGKLASAQGLYSLSVWMGSPRRKFLGEYLEGLKVKALPHARLLRKVAAPFYRRPIV